MKYTIYILIFLSILIFAGNQPLHAQKSAGDEQSLQVGVDASANVPTGDAGDAYETSFGFNARLNYFLMRQIAIGLSLGYLNWNFKNSGIGDYTFTMIPILASFQYYLMTSATLRLYIGLGAGPWLLNDKFTFMGREESRSETKFGIKPIAGVLIPLAAALMLHAQLSYPMVFSDNTNFTYLRVALGIMYNLGE